MRTSLAVCAALVVFGCSGLAQERTPATSPLAPGKQIYVFPTDVKEVTPALVQSLKNWGRWTVVEDKDSADLFVKLKVKGSNSKASMLLTITREVDGPTLWQSTEDTSRRIPYVKANAFTRSLAAIMDELKEAANLWQQN